MGITSPWRRGLVSVTRLTWILGLSIADSTTNPAFTAEEFELQFKEAKPCLFFVQPEVLSTVREAAAASGVRPDRIILFNTPQATPNGSIPDNGDNTPLTIQDLVDIGNGSDSSSFCERVLGPEEGKTKTAILFPSSGTTGTYIRSFPRFNYSFETPCRYPEAYFGLTLRFHRKRPASRCLPRRNHQGDNTHRSEAV
jgi:hypothetical protein